MKLRDLSAGSVVIADDNGTKANLRIASLFRKPKSRKVMALGVRLTDAEIQALGLIPQEIPGKVSSRYFAKLRSPEDQPGVEDLFVVVEFGASESSRLADAVEPVRLSKDLGRNVFGLKKMRVRSVVVEPMKVKKGFVWHSVHRNGFISGDRVNQMLNAKSGRQVTVERLAEAKSYGKRALARPGEGGMQVLSASGALVGFVVSGTENSALILPAEDLANTLHIDLVKPNPNSSLAAVL